MFLKPMLQCLVNAWPTPVSSFSSKLTIAVHKFCSSFVNKNKKKQIVIETVSLEILRQLESVLINEIGHVY